MKSIKGISGHTWYSIGEAAEMLGVSTSTLRRWAEKLPEGAQHRGAGLHSIRHPVNGYRLYLYEDIQRIKILIDGGLEIEDMLT